MKIPARMSIFLVVALLASGCGDSPQPGTAQLDVAPIEAQAIARDANVGTLTTGNGAAAFLLAGHDWDGETPDGITDVIRSETDLVFSVTRTQLFGPDDLENFNQIQAGYRLDPTDLPHRDGAGGVRARAPGPASGGRSPSRPLRQLRRRGDLPRLHEGCRQSAAGRSAEQLHAAPVEPSKGRARAYTSPIRFRPGRVRGTRAPPSVRRASGGMAGEGTSFPEWRSRRGCPQAGTVRAPPSRSAE